MIENQTESNGSPQDRVFLRTTMSFTGKWRLEIVRNCEESEEGEQTLTLAEFFGFEERELFHDFLTIGVEKLECSDMCRHLEAGRAVTAWLYGLGPDKSCDTRNTD